MNDWFFKIKNSEEDYYIINKQWKNIFENKNYNWKVTFIWNYSEWFIRILIKHNDIYNYYDYIKY